jgi:hypothetical protein
MAKRPQVEVSVELIERMLKYVRRDQLLTFAGESEPLRSMVREELEKRDTGLVERIVDSPNRPKPD